MLLDLTTVITPEHPALAWARQQDNPLGHVGTHLDVYECRHIPLEAFRCPGVLVDVRHTDEAGLADVNLDAIPAQAFVLFRTGRIEHHTYGESAYFHNHPQLAPELIWPGEYVSSVSTVPASAVTRNTSRWTGTANATVCILSKTFAASII